MPNDGGERVLFPGICILFLAVMGVALRRRDYLGWTRSEEGAAAVEAEGPPGDAEALSRGEHAPVDLEGPPPERTGWPVLAPYLALAAVSFLLAFGPEIGGRENYFYTFLYDVGLLKVTRVPARFFIPMSLGLAVLGGVGLDRLMRRVKGLRMPVLDTRALVGAGLLPLHPAGGGRVQAALPAGAHRRRRPAGLPLAGGTGGRAHHRAAHRGTGAGERLRPRRAHQPGERRRLLQPGGISDLFQHRALEGHGQRLQRLFPLQLPAHGHRDAGLPGPAPPQPSAGPQRRLRHLARGLGARGRSRPTPRGSSRRWPASWSWWRTSGTSRPGGWWTPGRRPTPGTWPPNWPAPTNCLPGSRGTRASTSPTTPDCPSSPPTRSSIR